MNRELGADFDTSAYSHRSHWDEAQHRIEMHLVSDVDQVVRVEGLGGLRLAVPAGSHLRTEISTKFTVDGVAAELDAAGLAVHRTWTDGDGDFLLTLARPR
jgi:L-histidine N-alpha-methyltransferase